MSLMKSLVEGELYCSKYLLVTFTKKKVLKIITQKNKIKILRIFLKVLSQKTFYCNSQGIIKSN